MTALTIDVIRLLFAFTVVVCIVTIAAVLIATADVDSMADPTPRLGEDEGAGPHVPDDVMRIIDAALPREQAWGKWVQYREAERQ